MAQPSSDGTVRCICGDRDPMAVLTETDDYIFLECSRCQRLLIRSKFVKMQRWFKAEEHGLVSLTTAKEMACDTCGGSQVHIRYLDGPWRCLGCRIREGERQLKKEGD